MLGTYCKNLQILKLNMTDPSEVARLGNTRFVPCNYMEKPSIFSYGNLDASVIVKHVHKLKHIEFRFSSLTDKALAKMCKACSNLKYLDLFGCRNLTGDGVNKEIKKPTCSNLTVSRV